MPDDLSKKRETQIKALWQESKERATQIFAEKNNLLYINLRKAPIETSALSCIPEETAKRAKIAAFQKIGKQIKVAVLDYSNPETIKIISQLRNEGNKVTVFLVTEESMNWVLSHYRFIHPRQQEVGQFIDVTSVKPIEFNELNQALLPLTSEEVSSMVSLILKAAVLIDASDVHLEPQDKQTLIRFRVDGVLYDVAKVDEKKSKNIQQRLKLLSGIKINIFNIPQNGRFTIQNENDFIDVRASSLPAPDGEFLVFRLLNPKWIAYGLNDLGMSKKGIKTFTSFLSAPNGMILATGPTGCGKTTTLYAFIREKVSPGIKIITIEDPIEYYIPSVNQTQITNKYDFATGLKSIMRQDPDVIMIGEIRDKETAKIAVQAALTGHLVFSTLHTNEASGAISRLRELEVDASLLPDSLKIVIGQRLVRRLCPHCKEKVKLPDEEKEKLIEAFSILSPKSEVKTPKDIPFIFKAKGCEKCHWLGYKEQIGIFEFFSLTPRIIQAIEQGADQDHIRAIAIDEGMVPLFHEGLIKVIEGITSMEEIIRVAGDISYVKELYKELFSQSLIRGVKITKEEEKEIEKFLERNQKILPLLGNKTTEKQIGIIIASALKSRATDIHIEPEEKTTQIRQRIDGILHKMIELDISESPKIINALKTLGGMKTEKTQEVQEGRSRLIFEDRSYDLRFSIIPGGYGESASIRILGGETSILDLEKLGFLEEEQEKIEKVLEKRVGLILSAGPTSSGKTTTLFSLLKKIAKPGVKVITVEDPIEYRLEGAIQTQVNEEKGYTFSKALRSLLRQNPDIFLIGEIRDKETAQLVWQASMTGHLVLSTIHTNDALTVLSRLQSLEIPGEELIPAINAIIAQRLVRRLCPDCKEKVPAPKEALSFINSALDFFPTYKKEFQKPYSFFGAKGCSKCNFTGFIGQIGVFEILIPDPTKINFEKIKFPKMTDDAIIKSLKGITSWEEVKRVFHQ